MDLLGGSSDEDSDNEETKIASNPVNSTKEVPTSKEQKMQRKILSLASVLPAHIYQQLTTGVDSDESDQEAESSKPSASKSTKDAAASLLKDLEASKPVREKGSSSLVLSKPLTAREVTKKIPPTSNLGQVFLEETVTIEKKVVRDIHGESKSTVKSTKRVLPAPPRPTVPSKSSLSVAPAPPVAATMDMPAYPVDDDDDEQTPAPPTHRKRSHREITKALKRGDFATALATKDVTHVKAAESTDYQLPTTGAYIHTHDIKLTSKSLYDPETGEMKAKNGRGKNQIHHVLAQAAQLEEDRLQRGLVGAAQNAKRYRANAKQKYGW